MIPIHDDYSTLQRAAQKQTKREREANRKLWKCFEAGEEQARARLPLRPDPKWSEAQKAAHKWGWRYANGLDTSKCGLPG